MSSPERIQPPVFPFEPRILTPVRSLHLDSGIPVFLIEAGTEEIMRTEFIFRAGSLKETVPLVSSTVNLMLTEGSENYTSEEINSILDYYGVFSNFFSGKDTAGMIMYFPNKQIEKVSELAYEILFRPLFPGKELSRLMKKRFRWHQVRMEKVQNLAMDQFFESIFGPQHPYGRQVKDIDFENITSGLLKEFHEKYYSKADMAVIISGRIHSETINLLNKFFGRIGTENTYIENPAFKIAGDARKNIKIDKQGALQAAVRIGSSTITRTDPDYPGLKFLNSLLGGYFGSRLMKNIREEKGFTYGIHSGVSSLGLSGFKLISTEVGIENINQAIEEIYKEIRLLQTEPVKPDEIEIVRNYMSGELVRMFDGPFALAESFKAVWEFGLDFSYYKRLAETVKTITPDEIMRLAQAYYKIDDLYEIIAG